MAETVSHCVRCGDEFDGRLAFCAECRALPDVKWLIDPRRWDERKPRSLWESLMIALRHMREAVR